ncbi:helix-turn-helix domain-containing protein [Saccharopolyspora gloriosae]|uniref:AraC family transcriptional activator FtrA n=1 Tax=Saccharopolyspora gloriosae TaxID=455344 RepID=A0A840NKP1_9PSEU|nr:helix-turn-helix domain-containing protein [Saccharopolyspora gloriosae]MBB5070693.1 AraC family transcriptional activator FtrA [Saccharopolyspora gloriosae]
MATSGEQQERRHRVAVLPTTGTAPFELGVISAVFGHYLLDLIPSRYELTVCSEDPGAVPLDGGAVMSTPHGLDDLAAADTVIVTSRADPHEHPSAALVEALHSAHRRGARLVSTCTGAFALAAAGMLDGRRATTHWRYADLLRSRFPLVEVDPAPLYIDEEDVLTGAGSAASLDLCLHLVRKDLGADLANTVARRLVIPPHREGGQAQYVESPVAGSPENDGVARSMSWALEHLKEPLTVELMAGAAHMSERSYLRHFAHTTGSSPMRWLTSQRVRASLPLLEKTRDSVDEVAGTVGFESVVTYRYHFNRIMRTSPSAYRRMFHAPQTEPPAEPRSACTGPKSGPS